MLTLLLSSAVSPQDFPPNRERPDLYLLLNGRYVVTAQPTSGFPPGCISLSDPQRTWCDVGMMDPLIAEEFDPFAQGPQAYLGAMDLEVGFASVKKITDAPYDQDMLASVFKAQFENQIFAPGQKIIMDHKNIPLLFTVKTVTPVDLSMEKGPQEPKVESNPAKRAMLTRQTNLAFYKDAKSPIKLKASATRPAANSIIAPDFKFEDMGIGGLDTEF